MQREKRRREKAGERLEIILYQRPSTRSECVDGLTCLYVACKYHLYLDVNPETGSVKINFPGIEPWEMAETCALDVAEKGGITLEDVGEILNLTRERVRQLKWTGSPRCNNFRKIMSLMPSWAGNLIKAKPAEYSG